ncbi:MAG: hypothetical protein P8Z30_15865 [Acidobacteriota bacterium]
MKFPTIWRLNSSTHSPATEPFQRGQLDFLSHEARILFIVQGDKIQATLSG